MSEDFKIRLKQEKFELGDKLAKACEENDVVSEGLEFIDHDQIKTLKERISLLEEEIDNLKYELKISQEMCDPE